MTSTSKINEIIAEQIAVESACSYEDAVHILNVSHPSIRKIAFTKVVIEQLSNLGVDKRVILDACLGISNEVSREDNSPHTLNIPEGFAFLD